MKKLMIAAAIVCASAFAQAATVSWAVTGLQDKSGAALNNGYAYVFTNKGTKKITTANLLAALQACTDAAGFQTVINQYAVMELSGAVSDGGQGSGTKLISESGLTPSQTNTKLYAVVFDTATITDASNWYMTEYSNANTVGASDGAMGSAAFTVADTGSHTGTSWNPVSAVPEPTSGLLLLLGVAGLALKRRRA